MLSAVFDTNVLVSSLIGSGRPRELWNKVLHDEVKLIVSGQILSEFKEVMAKPQLERYLRRSSVERFLGITLRKASVTKVKTHFAQATEDPDDNIVLEAAYSARADYIVTGDRRLLALSEFKGIRIVTVAERLEILTTEA
jgi:putative PIN family toxin of toxin-antitoxin system